jgi:hypothetical protein
MADPITITISVISLIFLGVGLFLQRKACTLQEIFVRSAAEQNMCPNCENRRRQLT